MSAIGGIGGEDLDCVLEVSLIYIETSVNER